MRVLVVEDDEHLRERLGHALRDRGHDVVTASTTAAAKELASEGIDAAVVDFRLGSESGLDLSRALRVISPGARVVIVSGEMTRELARLAAAAGAVASLSKPFDADDVLAALALPPA
jgi:two-component system response regulator RegA